MRNVLTIAALVLSAPLLVGFKLFGSMEQRYEVHEILPQLHDLPVVKRKALNVGIYYGARLGNEEHRKVMGPTVIVLPIGAASTQMFDALLPKMFARTRRISDLSASGFANKAIDFAIGLSLEYFNWRHGLESLEPKVRWRVSYRVTLYGPRAVPVASWIVTGSDPASEGYLDGVKMDLKDAARKFMLGFDAAARAAIAQSGKDRTPAPDARAVELTAMPAELPGVDASIREALKEANVAVVRLAARSSTERALVVRASNTRLRLRGGAPIEPSSLNSILNAISDEEEGFSAWFFGGPLGALANSEAEGESSEAASIAGNASLFSDRTLNKDLEQSGVILFRLPPGGTSTADAVLTAWVVDPAAANGVQLEVPLTGAPGAVARTPSTDTPKPPDRPERSVAPKPAATASAAPVSRATAPPPGPSKSAPTGVGGLRQGDRWEYRFVDSRKRRPASRRFEIEQINDESIIERIELEDGTKLTAAHRGGAYLNMLGGMQFAPYFLAFQPEAAAGPVDNVRIEGGDACATRSETANDYAAVHECHVRARFTGIETVTVPAGAFRAHVMRVTVVSEHHSAYRGTGETSVADARFWISPEAGRIVKAVIQFEAERPWTETMELVSMKAGLQEDQRAQHVVATTAQPAAIQPTVAASRTTAPVPAPAVATTPAPRDGVTLGTLLALGAQKLLGAEARAMLTSGTLRGVTAAGNEVVVSYNPDGTLTGSVGGNNIADGTWRIEESGRSCVDLWMPKYRRTYENLCRYWFKLGKVLYFPTDSDSDTYRAARMSKRTITPR